LGLLASVARDEELVVCIDGFASLLRGERGGTNKGALLSALANIRCRLIGIMTPREYEELVADDADMLEHFARVDVPEPDIGTSIKLLRHFSKGLEQKYGIAIEPAAVELAVVLSANYILNEYLPGKALKILSRVCEGIDYERVFSFQIGMKARCSVGYIRAFSP
jgi:ATP-dependent Clp protease ATP-binding subunit ClpA